MALFSDTQMLLPTQELEIIDSLVGESEAMRRCLQLAEAVMSAGVPVMLAGESGVGKSLLIRYIHTRSARRSRPCMNLRCANLGPVELRSRLFGAGSSGGLLAGVTGGSVIFDGVDQMPGAGQRELFYLLSSPDWAGTVDVRLFSTVGTGSEPGAIFTEGLEHLLSEAIIRVPALRERREDMERLSQRALDAANRLGGGKRVLGFSRGAVEFLHNYDFPGNVRELFFMVNQGVRQARREMLFAEDFRMAADDGAEEPGGGGQLLSLAEVERRYISRVLVRTGWKKSAAARVLQISETMLNRKMKLYDLEREQ